MLLICSFNGFIDSFVNINSTYTGITIVKSIDLTVLIVHFVTNCTRKKYYHGKVKKYINEIVAVYASSMRLFFDLAGIILSALFLAFPQNGDIGIILFFLIIAKLVLSRGDLLQLEIYYLRS